MNPVFLALSVSNPGLLGLAFIGGSGGYSDGPHLTDNLPGWLTTIIVVVCSILVVAIGMALIFGAVVGSYLISIQNIWFGWMVAGWIGVWVLAIGLFWTLLWLMLTKL